MTSLLRSSSVQLRAPVLPSPLVVPSNADKFSILPLSDLHLPSSLEAARTIIQNRTYLRRMDYVQLLGDMCACYGTDREYSQVAQFVKQLEMPYGAINGNHEIYFEGCDEGDQKYGCSWPEATLEKKRERMLRFLHFFGYENPWRATHSHLGSFIFLGLDDFENSKPESLSQKQCRFLEQELDVQPNVPAFVFCHVPLMFDTRLDMIYYDEERTACFEPETSTRKAMQNRAAPIFWMSGHIHLRPDHYLFNAYTIVPNVWQVHCPDSWGYSRWLREQTAPQRHSELYSRHLEITRDSVTLIAHDHKRREDIARQEILL